MSGEYCDCHLHIVADPARHALSPARTYLPGIATLETVRRLAAPHGIGRFVVVQPSFYGTDNSVLLDALETLGAQGRGIAVLDPAITDLGLLGTLAARGVCGLRINLYSAAKDGPTQSFADLFGNTAKLARDMSWHVQVIANLPTLAEAAPLLAASPVKVVIDHYGLPGRTAPDEAAGRALLDLLRLPHVWVKLSAPYRSGTDPLAIRPDPAWLSAVLQTAPERCVWGSDWPWTPPHPPTPMPDTPLPYRPLDYGAMVRAFHDALPSGSWFAKVMRDNPARLYGYPG